MFCEAFVKHFAKLRRKPGFYLMNANSVKALETSGLIKDIELAREARQNRDDEKHAGGFWDLSLEIMESENPQELIYNYLIAFSELKERATNEKTINN